MKTKHYTFFFLTHLFFAFRLSAQFYNLPNDYFFSLLTERQLAAKDSSIHTGLKPYIHFFSSKYAHVSDSHRVYRYIVEDPGVETAFYKHLVRVEPKTENFKLHIDPILNLEKGHDFSDSIDRYPYTNTRGVIASAYIGNNFYMETMFAESQSRFPNYIAQVATLNSVVPGQGRWKVFKVTGFDYAFSSGFISIQPIKNLNIQLGHGKQKIGSGYRSLLLSDNAFNYPYIRITQQWFKGRLQYTNIYAVLTNLRPASVKKNPYAESLLQKKAASFQYLSLNIHKAVNLSLFQGIIWRPGNDRNAHDLPLAYFNPVIYTSLISEHFRNQANSMSGVDLKVKLNDKLHVYSQFMCDYFPLGGITATKALTGLQTGLNYFDALGIKNLFLQAEYNNVVKGSYLGAGPFNIQGFYHYDENLAYTPGYGQEFVFISDYRYKRYFANIKYNYQDISRNCYVNLLNLRFGYVINPAYNLNISAGFNYRNQNFYTFKTLNNETSYLYLGIKTTFYNTYYDF